MFEKYKLVLMGGLLMLSIGVLGVNILRNHFFMYIHGTTIKSPVSLYPGSSQEWNQDTSRSLSPDPQNASENNTKCEKNCDDSEGEQTEQTDQNDQIKQGNVKLLSSQEIHDKMKSIESKKFGGRWSISEHKDRSKISSNLNNIGGIVKSKLDYHKDSTTFPTFKLDCTLYDGDYRDQVVYLKVSFDEKFMTQNQSTFTLDHKNTNVEISYGRLYSITQDHT